MGFTTRQGGPGGPPAVAYFADAISDVDVEWLGVGRGTCKSQSCFELLAVIVALKLWRHRLEDCSRVAAESLFTGRFKRRDSEEVVLCYSRSLGQTVSIMTALDMR